MQSESDGKYRILLKANMGSTLQDDQILCDIENYENLNAFVNVEKIDRILAKRSLYTHLLTLIVDKRELKSAGEKLSLNSLKYPDWLESVNDDSGKDVTKNMDKTTGIKYIVQGVADAYKTNSELAEMRFVISKK